MLGVRFAEVKRNALLELGTDFIVRNRVINSETVSAGSFAGKVSTPSNPLLFSENVDLFLSIPTQNFEAIIHALEEKNASLASRVLFIKDGEVFHQLYRGESTNEEMYQKIAHVLTLMATGGDKR
jgi:hypothetical protein